MLLTGAAGTGKTHLLCDIAQQRIAAGKPTVLLMGQRFGDADPWGQALRQLDLASLRAEEFVGALEAVAQAADCRALLIIDALNEGEGMRIWPSNLAAFLALMAGMVSLVIGLPPEALGARSSLIGNLAIFGVIALFLLATVAGNFAANRIRQAHTQARESAFVLETTEIRLKIEERIKAYRQVLRGAQALFAASQQVTRQEWHQYVSSLRLHTDYAGIQGVGFALHLSANQLASHEQHIRAEGFPDYRVSPPGPRDEYSAIVFLEPFDWRNQRAFGYDMLSEPVRHEAMDRARTLGVAAMSGKVRLVQETSTDIQPGVLLYLPVFRWDASLDTPAQRERAFVGWVYMPFRLGDLIAGTLGESADRIRIRIFDGHDDNPAALLFDSQAERPPAAGTLTRRDMLELDSRVWTLTYDSTFGSPPDQEAIWLEQTAVAVIGALFVLLTAFFCAARQRAHHDAHGVVQAQLVSGAVLLEHGHPLLVEAEAMLLEQRLQEAVTTPEVVVQRRLVALTRVAIDLAERHRLEPTFREQTLGRRDEDRLRAQTVGSLWWHGRLTNWFGREPT
mgnify:CR=1 FL=1